MRNPSTIFLLAIIAVLLMPFDMVLRIIIATILLLLMLWTKRASLLFVRSARKILDGKGDAQKNWSNLAKAVRMGLGDQQLMTAASIYIQRGDWHEGARILDEYTARPFQSKNLKARKEHENWIATAKTMRSMTYWMEGDLDGAIKLMDEVHKSGSKNANIFINYGTYLLEKGDLAKAKKIITEAEDMEEHSNGLADNHGWYDIIQGDWDHAEYLYAQVIAKNPTFAEAWLHLAQIKIHRGKLQEAIDLLKKASGCRFTQTSGVKKEVVDQLLSLLENPDTRLRAATSIEQDRATVASGKLPTLLEGDFERCEQAEITPFDSKDAPHTSEPEAEEQEAPQQKHPHADDEVNTDLDDSDEEYLRSHGF